MKKFAFLTLAVTLAISAGLQGIAARPAAQTGSDLLRLLPDGSGIVLVDVQKLTASSLWSTISAQNKIKSAIDKAQSEFEKLGLKLSDIQEVALVIPPTGMNDFAAAVTGNFDQATLIARLRANQKIKLNSESYKNAEIFNIAGSNPSKKSEGVSFTFYDARTAIVGSSAGVRASIDARAGDKPNALQNEKLGATMAQNSPAAIRFALVVTPSMTSSLQASGAPLPDLSSINLIFGTVDVTTGIELDATLRNDTAAHATALAEQLNGLLSMAKGFLGSSNDLKRASIVTALNSVKVTGADVDVKISGNLPGEFFSQVMR